MKKIQNIYDNPQFFSEYEKIRKDDLGFNNLIEQAAMFSLFPDLKGKHVLEIGCGFGACARYMIDHAAARVLAIDPSKNMIEQAKKASASEKINFQQIALENFEAEAGSFDLVISSVALHYIEDYRAVIKNISKWLKPRGILIFSVEHPICTAYPAAILKTDEQGKHFHPIYNYRDEGLFTQTWLVDGVQKYHRTISTYINTLLEFGFTLEKILEPMPSDDLIAKQEKFSIHKIRPPLLMIKATKK